MFELDKKIRTKLCDDMTGLLDEYDYNYSKDAVFKIIDTWVQNKSNLIELFMKHPNYNGNFQIIRTEEYNHSINRDRIYAFCYMVFDWIAQLLILNKIDSFGYITIKKACARVNRACYLFEQNPAMIKLNSNFDGKSHQEWLAEQQYWHDLAKRYRNYFGHLIYAETSSEQCRKANTICEHLKCFGEPILDQASAALINKEYPELKVRAGQKVSRVMNKFCTHLGFDKHPEYNKEFAKYADALCGRNIKQPTVLSIHPIDYLTMSFGNSWSSCNTIDNHNKREMSDEYSGAYRSGTMSYMLDGSSMVFYTVSEKNQNDVPQLAPKILRNMFHYERGALIQGRVYPQGNDDSQGIYKQIRDIAVKMITTCTGTFREPHQWVNEKGTDACDRTTFSRGTHHRDYIDYDNCNVTDLTGNESVVDIGHNPICITCGTEHDERQLVCNDCHSDEFKHTD